MYPQHGFSGSGPGILFTGTSTFILRHLQHRRISYRIYIICSVYNIAFHSEKLHGYPENYVFASEGLSVREGVMENANIDVSGHMAAWLIRRNPSKFDFYINFIYLLRALNGDISHW